MPARNIPERNPVGDPFSGVIVQVGEAQALALQTEASTDVIASGNFVVRYGLRFLGKLHLSIVPGLVVLDYGDMMTGEDAWEFLLKQSNLYPRSEVVGYRDDGADDMVFIKALDMSVPPQVLVYADEKATTPLAKPATLIAPDSADLPSRLLEYLPRFETVLEWKANL